MSSALSTTHPLPLRLCSLAASQWLGALTGEHLFQLIRDRWHHMRTTDWLGIQAHHLLFSIGPALGHTINGRSMIQRWNLYISQPTRLKRPNQCTKPSTLSMQV